MSISQIMAADLGSETWKNLYIHDLTISGSFTGPTGSIPSGPVGPQGNTGSTGATGTFSIGSARYNIDPSSRPGLIGGYLIFAADPNPSFIPFTTNTPQGLYDYISPNGNFHMVDPYTLQIDITGQYNISIQMLVLSNSSAQVVFQLLSSQFGYVIGTVPPVISPITQLSLISSILPSLPYTNGGILTAPANETFTSGDQLKLAYITSVDAEISATCCLSIIKLS